MRKLAIVEFVTLDGVMQGLGSPEEDREGGFEYGGWGAPYGDEVLAAQAAKGMSSTAVYLFGRKTYEKMAAHWPREPAENPIAAALNTATKYVVTSTLNTLDWAGSRIVAGEVPAAVSALKQQGQGTIVVLGSGLLVQTLIEHDLIDEYRLMLHPLVLGAGKRLLRQTPHPLAMRLVECTPTTTGVVILTYQRASEGR
ncbi:MAG: dihydrofolate reductase family protein [Solirubrobacteraceae bacterium]